MGENEFQGSDFYIIPSSVNELLVTPAENGTNGANGVNGANGAIGADGDMLEQLKFMVKAVNESEVAVEERLSDSVYIYEKGLGVRIA